MKRRLLFYSQHVLGLGHLVRSLEIVRALRDFEVVFLNGGDPVPECDFPPEVDVVQLPPIRSGEDFQELLPSSGGQELWEVQTARSACILETYDRHRPDIVLIELFPFGRSRFAFELAPLLARNRFQGRPAKIVCSLRDILVSKPDAARHEERVLELMNQYFDLLLIHSDPAFQRLEETFSRVGDLTCDVRYTGYVAQPLPPSASVRARPDAALPATGEPWIVASIGGGRVGGELLHSAIAASRSLRPDMPHRLSVFTGPFMPPNQVAALQQLAANDPQIAVERFSPQFVECLGRAALSVSMAGYNTCMNLLTTGVRALVLPFRGGGNDEQATRAEKLAALGVVEVLGDDDLEPARLAARMQSALRKEPVSAGLDLNGAERTKELLQEIVPEAAACEKRRAAMSADRAASDVSSELMPLRACLERLGARGRSVRVFLRDDDVDVDGEALRTLLDLGLSRGVPLNLEIVPHLLETSTIRLLRQVRRWRPDLFAFHQHGWQHANHESEGRKCEFGPARSYDAQRADIARGKETLETLFGTHFYPAFTPPWNRCTTATCEALAALGFAVLSRDRGATESTPAQRFGLIDVPVTLDLFRWKDGAELRPATRIVSELMAQIEGDEPIGILLHHKVMDRNAFAFLDQLVAELQSHPQVSFHTLEALASQAAPEAVGHHA